MISLLNDLLNWTGANNVSGNQYGFWSGFGSDLPEFAIVGVLINHYRNHKCATCWRIGRHEVNGTNLKTCHKHATLPQHTALRAEHARQYPKQHKLFNAKER